MPYEIYDETSYPSYSLGWCECGSEPKEKCQGNCENHTKGFKFICLSCEWKGDEPKPFPDNWEMPWEIEGYCCPECGGQVEGKIK